MSKRRQRRGSWIRHENERNWVYSLWAGDQCLYVGMTNDIDRRLLQHRSQKPWWHEVDRVVVDQVLGRGAAMEFEAHDIRTHRPRYNVAHNPDHKKDPLAGITVESRGLRNGT